MSKSVPDLRIKTSVASITNLNTRGEIHGEETVPAVDISIRAVVQGEGVEILKALHVPELVNAMYDSDGDPSEASTHMQFKMTQKVKNLHVVIEDGRDNVAVALMGCDLKAIEFVPQPGFGIDLKAKVQTQIDMELFKVLWAMQIDGECAVTIEARQSELNLAA